MTTGNSNKNTVDINNFATRQLGENGKGSRFSYYDGPNEDLINLVQENFENKQQGYREGVYTVPVSSENFYSGTSKIDSNSIIWSRMEARRRGEEPVMTRSNLNGVKEPANYTNIVLYSHDVLAEGNEFSTDADYEIISINASMDEKQPMTPETIKRNHYGEAGGTKDLKTEEEFQRDLKESEEYWSKYSTVDDMSNFRRFYDKEKQMTNEQIKDLLLENCKCSDAHVMFDYISSNLGIELETQDILRIDTSLNVEKEKSIEKDDLEL